MERAESATFTPDNPAPVLRSASAGCAPLRCVTVDSGCVETAAWLAQAGLRPALLNFAHGYNCGGGFDHAQGSQEEDIFRKTSVFLSLWPHRRSDDGPGVLRRGQWIGDFDEALARREPFYPHTECGGVYSPHVRIVKDLPGDASSLPVIGVLTVAAQDTNRERPFKRGLLLQKLRTALWMAASQGHDSLVLGAFGCGYFGNPAEVVAETFQQLLGDGGEFAAAFRIAAFAVPRRYDRDNAMTFERCFPAASKTQLLARSRKQKQNLAAAAAAAGPALGAAASSDVASPDSPPNAMGAEAADEAAAEADPEARRHRAGRRRRR